MGAATLCETLGHHVEEARPEIDGEAFSVARRIIVDANVRAQLDARAAALRRPLSSEDVERATWTRATEGGTATAAAYVASITVLHSIGRALAKFFARYDVLLSPSMCQPAYPLGVLNMMSSDLDTYTAALHASVGFTSLFNAAGTPAMSVPLAWSKRGLPIGVQFAAPFGDEATPLRLAAQLEATRPWKDHRPPVVPPATIAPMKGKNILDTQG